MAAVTDNVDRMPYTCSDVERIVNDAIADIGSNIISSIKEEITYPFREALNTACEELEEVEEEVEDLKEEVKNLKAEVKSLEAERDELKIRLNRFLTTQMELNFNTAIISHPVYSQA